MVFVLVSRGLGVFGVLPTCVLWWSAGPGVVVEGEEVVEGLLGGVADPARRSRNLSTPIGVISTEMIALFVTIIIPGRSGT